ncbi:MAG: hypothetical protein OWV35_01365, partial [Firmicutes bacterium]|nr:hypothetical protein [Bacillota bacterium]
MARHWVAGMAALALSLAAVPAAAASPRPALPVEITAVDTGHLTLQAAGGHGRLLELPWSQIHLRALAYPAGPGSLLPGEEGIWLGGSGDGKRPHTLLLLPAARGRLVRRLDGWGLDAGKGPPLALDLAHARQAGLPTLTAGHPADAFGVRTGSRVVVTLLAAPPRRVDTTVQAVANGRLTLQAA